MALLGANACEHRDGDDERVERDGERAWGWPGCPAASARARREGTSRWRSSVAERHFWEVAGSVIPVEILVDSVGRIVIPKPLRDALGLTAGSTVDVSRYGAGLQLVPTGRTARLVEESGVLVATGETVVDDDVVFGLIDAGRR